ncbi:MAG: hypothetical protein HY075_05800 [Deltaproteobacteria bacterium]|nr:hypothetical protein [Deltaproteobacteria bacterium]
MRHGRAISIEKWAFVALLLVFLAASNRWLPWREAIEYAQSYDVTWYEKISRVAPSFPTEPVRHHHAQRFVTHYVTGTLSSVTGVSLPAAYRFVWLLLTLAVVVLADRLFQSFRLKPRAYWLCMAAFLLNPYALRFYALAFGMVQDLTFLVGSLVLLLGLRSGRLATVVAGAAIASIGRQTAVMLMPGLGLWMFYGEPWRRRARKLTAFALVCGVIVGVYVLTDLATASFSLPSENVGTITSLFYWLVSPAFSVSALVELFARALIPFAVPAGLLLGMGESRALKRVDVLACLLMAAGITAQPLLGGPIITGRNASRLSALGLAFVFTALAATLEKTKALPESGPAGSARRSLFAAAILLLAVSSLHHLYSVVGPPGAAWFAAIQLGVAAALLALGRVSYRMA